MNTGPNQTVSDYRTRSIDSSHSNRVTRFALDISSTSLGFQITPMRGDRVLAGRWRDTCYRKVHEFYRSI